MSDLATEPASARPASMLPRVLLTASLAALLAVQLLQLVQWLRLAQDVLAFPYQLDFGEGVVWQQARMILRGDGYTPLSVEPHIVFHYPPVFHLLSGLAATATGDMLAGGRLVSMVSTVAAASLLSLLVRASVSDREPAVGRVPRLVVMAAVALLFLGHPVVVIWSMVMRVDMAAVALGLAGAYLALRAPERPAALLGAALCFALELYTKQSHIALPLATFGTLLLTSPALALRLVGLTAALGLGALAWMSYATGGGFLTHVVGYNLNRFAPENIRLLPNVVLAAMGIGIVGTAFGFVSAAGLAARLRRHGLHATRTRLRGSPAERTRTFLTLFLVVSTLLLPLSLKSGASVNYYIEWIAALVPITGLMMTRWIDSGSRRWPTAVALILVILAQVDDKHVALDDAAARLEPLARLIAEADGPVLSDEMVMVIRSDRDVIWESAIHAELAALGAWDPEPFAQRIRSGEFALIVTEGLPGDQVFDARYPESIATALTETYPVQQTFGGYVAHLPAKAAEAGRD